MKPRKLRWNAYVAGVGLKRHTQKNLVRKLKMMVLLGKLDTCGRIVLKWKIKKIKCNLGEITQLAQRL